MIVICLVLTKYLKGSNLREEGFILAYSFKQHSPPRQRKAWWQGHEVTRHIVLMKMAPIGS